MTALIIANTQIRRDAAGRYCLNDLHQASGGESRHRPGRWLDSEKTRELIACIAIGDETAGIPAVSDPLETHEGRLGGTYAVKELVYAYAMWISAAFHLHVIRAYDALQTAARAEPAPGLLPGPQHRADQLVSAGRIFNAALRVARSLRLTPEAAIASAAHCAARHTGIDWPAELGVPLPEPDRGTTAQHDALAAWAAERDGFTTDDAIAGAGLGQPVDRATQMRTAAQLKTLGYHPTRTAAHDPAGLRQRLWRRSLDS